jgi:hypothetical protein
MPEILLCCDCKQSINKAMDDYVVVKKATDSYPEVLALVACEQKIWHRITGAITRALSVSVKEQK